MSNLAPLMVGTYTRLDHLKQTIAALQANTLAQQTDLFVYSDAPLEQHQDLVKKVRAYLQTIKGFKTVTIIERRKNGRVANNRGGIKQLLEQYGKVIFLEDDNITAPGFLQFMNDALSQYKESPEVLSICGYTPDFKKLKPHSDVLALPRFVGWGIGIWLDKFNQIKSITPDDYQEIINSKSNIKHIEENHGRDLLNRFRAEANGHLDGLDTKGCYLQTKTRMFSIHPKRSLVNNIGNDGSGVHASLNDKYAVTLWDKEQSFILDNCPCLNEDLVNESINWFDSDQRDISPAVIDNIIEQLQHENIETFSIWGLDVMTQLFLERIEPFNFRVNYYMDSWATENTQYNGQTVITPTKAFERGEHTFVILSFASRLKMAQLAKEINPDITTIVYREHTAQ